jgi:nucleotide-binding universal stress UspA family protein
LFSLENCLLARGLHIFLAAKVIMNKRVVVAMDLQELMPWAVLYAVNLAGRLKASLTLLAVAGETAGGKKAVAGLTAAQLEEGQRRWLDQVMKQGREEGVSLELFLAAGSFSQAILEFVGSRADIQFLIIGVGGTAKESASDLSPLTLSRLHQVFPGEILLVREQGRITNLSEMPVKPKWRES